MMAHARYRLGCVRLEIGYVVCDQMHARVAPTDPRGFETEREALDFIARYAEPDKLHVVMKQTPEER
jgi:hypothetical protein